jgi:hypothetical protein
MIKKCFFISFPKLPTKMGSRRAKNASEKFSCLGTFNGRKCVLQECLDELASFLLEYAGKTWPGQGQRTKDAVYVSTSTSLV